MRVRASGSSTTSDRGRPFSRPKPVQTLWLVFILTIVLPGLLLTYFGLQALRQDRLSADRQIRERMDQIADDTILALEKAMLAWQEALDRWPADGQKNPADAPKPLLKIIQTPGSGVVVSRGIDGLQAFPRTALAYWPQTDIGREPSAPLPAELAAAESAELKNRDYQKSIDAYKDLLASAPQYRSWLLLRMARSYRKAELRNEALTCFRELQKDTVGTLGSLPARLVAGYEICSMIAETGPSAAAGAPGFARGSASAAKARPLTSLEPEALSVYRELVGGSWRLDRYQYAFYSDKLRGWLEAGPSSEEFLRWRDQEAQKLALSSAVDQLLQNPQRAIPTDVGPALAFWRPEPFAGLVLSPRYFAADVWPGILAAQKAENFDIHLTDAAGGSLDASSRPAPSSLGITRGLDSLGLPWRLRIQPRPGNTLYADLNLRQNLTLAILILMLAILLFGGYLTIRTTRKEVEIARLKSEFVSTVSHEFRSPLTGIRQLAGLLRDGRVKDENGRRDYYEMICRESDRLSRLVENLLDFSRMEEGRKEYRFERLATRTWLQALAAGFESEAAFPGVTIETSLPDDLPDLYGDPEALTVAIHNLLDNAMKYSPGASAVRLEAEAVNGRVLIRVRDRGLGIPEAEQPHVFDKFYRGRNAGAVGVKGAGLGLALVREIVRAHGGAVALQSRPGEGSTFTLDLPAAKPGPKPSEPDGKGRTP